jgi:hypothetical protein
MPIFGRRIKFGKTVRKVHTIVEATSTGETPSTSRVTCASFKRAHAEGVSHTRICFLKQRHHVSTADEEGHESNVSRMLGP